MYDEPSGVNTLGKHRIDPKSILRLRRLIFSSRATKTKTRSSRRTPNASAHMASQPEPLATGSVHNTPSPETFGSGQLIRYLKRATDLKCRCYQFQVLSRGFTLAGIRQDHLRAECSIRPVIRVKQCGLFGLDVLQGTSQRVLVPGGRVHCEGTKADNSHSNQHCRDQAYGDLGLELFHWRIYRQYG